MIDRYLPLLRAAMAAVLSVAAGGVQAQANLEQMTQRWLDDALARNMPTQSPLRMEVSVGALDERLRLAPCARVEPYLPAGARLWGRTRLGLRRRDGRRAPERPDQCYANRDDAATRHASPMVELRMSYGGMRGMSSKPESALGNEDTQRAEEIRERHRPDGPRVVCIHGTHV